MHELIRNFINGEFVASKSNKTAKNMNPATGEPLGDVVVSGREEAESAIAAAKAALPAWRRTPAPKRGELLAKAAIEMARRKEELARALTLEEGKTLGESLGEVQKAINTLEFQAGEGRRLNGETVPSDFPSTFCWTQREALGVVALVTPWNFPVAIPIWKLGPALVTGNTVVLKPASITPWTASIIAEIFATRRAAQGRPQRRLRAGLDGGRHAGHAQGHRRHLVHGIERDRHQAVCRRGRAAQEGSVRDGRQESGDRARRRRPRSGGDGDGAGRVRLDRPALHGDVARDRRAKRSLEPFTRKVIEKARELRVGDGIDPSVNVGPLVDEQQFRSVLELHR